MPCPRVCHHLASSLKSANDRYRLEQSAEMCTSFVDRDLYLIFLYYRTRIVEQGFGPHPFILGTINKCIVTKLLVAVHYYCSNKKLLATTAPVYGHVSPMLPTCLMLYRSSTTGVLREGTRRTRTRTSRRARRWARSSPKRDGTLRKLDRRSFSSPGCWMYS